MATAYVAIAKNIFTTSAASVTFSSIPATYTDLYMLISARITGTGGAMIGTLRLELNTDNGANYSYIELLGNGTACSVAVGSTSAFMLRSPADGQAANIFCNDELYISNYTNSALQKQASTTSAVDSNSVTAGDTRLSVGASKWNNTAAITSIKLVANSGSIDTGSSFYLYGIKNT